MSSIWDDSALINAFNASVTKYQEMHGLSHCSYGAGKCSPEEAEVDRSVTAEETSIIESSKDNGMLQDIKSMPLDDGAYTSKNSCVEPSSQVTSMKYSHVNASAGSAGNKVLQGQDPKQDLFCQIQQLEQQQKLLQDKVNNLYSFMNYTEGNYGTSSGLTQPSTQSDGVSYEGSYGGFSHHCPHYHWGFYPHPQCLWHNNSPVTTPATFTQSSQPLAKDRTHAFSGTLHNVSPDYAQSSRTPIGASADMVAEAVRDAICKCSSSLTGISGTKSSETLQGDKTSVAFAELLTVWFNAGFQTARYLLEKPE